ncbi:hypothetical protein L7F22_035110 [Adiantum nelumboides]|nr:hypothetical protein [Adiantum nelumboides]
MPLFRSHSSGDTASRRSDLNRQIGCIAGFLQIFDPQVRSKQIAGPAALRKVAHNVAVAPQPPPPAESCTSSNFVVSVAKESDANREAEQGDGKVAVLSKGEARASSEACIGDGEPQGLGSIQTTKENSKDSTWANLTQQEKVHRPPAQAAANATEEPSKASTMVRHSSFMDRSHDEIAFSPRRGNVAAYAAGGRRFTSHGQISTHEENRTMPKEDEKWGYWSSPAENWPSYDSIQDQEHDVMAGERQGPWLPKGGRAAERHWAAEDSLEEWKQSLRALVRLKEDDEAGMFRGNSGLVAPKASSRALCNELPPTSPARASAFDFKEVMRWSQRASSQVETSARRSWDDRDLPRSIAELRDAINARSRAVSAASPPPSPRPPSVVARLMGLDNLPHEQAPLVNTIERKPSSEAKLLQQLLQCTPSPAHLPLPPSPVGKSQHRGANVKDVVEYPAMPSASRGSSTRSELQSMLKRIETMSQRGSSNTSFNTKPLGTLSRYSKSYYENVEPPSIQSLPVKKSNHQNYLPVVVLKQSEEIRSPSPRTSHGYHDEIEKRLRQLGLQSSEQERKTLKQILEAMQHKGLLKPPDETRSINGTRRQHAHSPGSPLVSSGHIPPPHPSSDSVESLWCSTPLTKRPVHSNVNTPQNAKRDGSTSIVIMKPLANSASRVTANTETSQNSNNERASASAHRAEKITLRKRKNAVKIENSTVKDSGSRSRSRHSSTSQLGPVCLHTPVQTRKHSLKLRQGQVHVAKGSSRSASVEQAGRSNSDLSTSRRRNRELAALPNNCPKPISISKNEIRSRIPDEAIYGDISDVSVSDHDMQKISDLCSSDGSLGDPSPQETAVEDDMAIATPPREFKLDGSFGDIDACFVKDVEQCSPVSVLDTSHLSNSDAVESSDEFEGDGGLRDYQVDANICSPLLEEVRFPSMIMQPAALEMLSQIVVKSPVDEAHVCNVELSDAHEQASPFNKDIFGHESDSACSSVDAGDQESREAASASKKHIVQVATWGNDCDDCLHMNEDDYTQINEASCATDIEEKTNACERAMRDDAINEDMLRDSYGSTGEEMVEDAWTSNVEFCYTKDVLRGAGVAKGPAEGWCMAEGWVAGGGNIGLSVYEELEEHWDALEEEESCVEDRDMGGELYRKSQQAAMRRRLLFDCMNEILEQCFSWVGTPGACGGLHQLSIQAVWGNLQQLEEGPRSAKDSMYAMLEQDLLHDADYSIPKCWNGKPTQLASVALHLEQDILDSLLLEVLPHVAPMGDSIV